MNARQKAKKYKRMYEQLLNQPVKFRVEQHKIDTLRFERFYPEELFIPLMNSNYLQEIIVKDLVQCISNSLDKYIDYHTEFCQHMNKYRVSGAIKVVCRE